MRCSHLKGCLGPEDPLLGGSLLAGKEPLYRAVRVSVGHDRYLSPQGAIQETKTEVAILGMIQPCKPHIVTLAIFYS